VCSGKVQRWLLFVSIEKLVTSLDNLSQVFTKNLTQILVQTWAVSGKLVSRMQVNTSKPMTDDIQRGSRGPAPNWNLGRTRTIRVPIAIADQLMEIARRIDSGEPVESAMGLKKEDREELSKSPQSANCPC
jgi:hypothetical protein